MMTEDALNTNQPDPRSLWFSLLGGPIVYSVYFMAVYFLGEVACRVALGGVTLFGLNGISFWTAILTVVAALIAAYGGFTAYRNWQRTRRDEDQRLEESASLMAFIGMWLSGLFTGIIILTGLPALFWPLCDWI
jgi:hypothetical protein